MSADLFAGLVEVLDELAGEICARIVGVLGDPADLAVRPIERGGLVRDVVSGPMLVIDFLLQLAIRGEGTLLRHLAGSVVVELQLSSDRKSTRLNSSHANISYAV